MGKEFWLGKPPGKSKMELGGGEAGATLQDLMLQRAQGQGPSAAELMMDRGMQQQIAAGRSMAASMPGVSPGLAMRQAGQREASAMSNVGQQTGILRAQEQAAAQGLLANWLQNQQRMQLEQDLYNAARQQRSGMLGPTLSTLGSMGGAWLGGPWGTSAGQQMGQGIGQGFSAGGPEGWGQGY